MRDRILLTGLFFLILFNGCSTKINLQEYRLKAVVKAKNAPKNLKATVINKAAIEKFKNDINQIVTNRVVSKLKESNLIQELTIITPFKEREYIELAQTESEGEENIKFYLIKGSVDSLVVTDNGTYHPPIYNKKGKKISSSYYSYEVCAVITGMILSLPSKSIIAQESVKECASTTSHIANYNLINGLKLRALNSAADSLVDELKEVFTPKGYIYEVRENKDHDLIAHITLGRKNGLKQNMKIYIYRLKKDKLGNINEIKIGEGRVSDKLFDNNAWITVDLEDNYQLKIGDEVKPDISSSFFEKLFNY